MIRVILFAVLISILFSGFESAAEAAAPVWGDGQDVSHEMHGKRHTDDHQHEGEGDSHHDDHYCHCNVHAAALLSVEFYASVDGPYASQWRYDGRFTSLARPPLLRPPDR